MDETSSEKLLNAAVDEADENSMILIVDNEEVLYEAIENVTYSFLLK